MELLWLSSAQFGLELNFLPDTLLLLLALSRAARVARLLLIGP